MLISVRNNISFPRLTWPSQEKAKRTNTTIKTSLKQSIATRFASLLSLLFNCEKSGGQLAIVPCSREMRNLVLLCKIVNPFTPLVLSCILLFKEQSWLNKWTIFLSLEISYILPQCVFSTVSGMYEIALRGAFQDIVISWNGLNFYLLWLIGRKVSRHIRTMAILAKQIVTGSHFLCLASQTCKGSLHYHH